MPRLVLDPGAAIRLLTDGGGLAPDISLVAPTLLRDQVLDRLYRSGVPEAERTHARLAALKVRYLGDRALRQVTWRVAAEAGAATTFAATYVALTMLQGDALVALDDEVRTLAEGRVPLRPFEALGLVHA